MMHAEDLVLDGNAAAGVLADLFVPETTMARATCAGCGAQRPLGAARLYAGMGTVLRCVDCDLVLLRVVVAPGRLVLEMSGVRRLELPLA
jgi:hypothetical protein